MRSNTYSAGLMSESFWFLEFKKLVAMKYAGKTLEEIKMACIMDNALGMQTDNRIKRACGYLLKRIENMDDKLLALFTSSDLATQKLINLIIILREDRLFYEFMNEVYKEKCILGAFELEPADINVFFKNKREQDVGMDGWAESTFKHLKSNYRNFLTEADLLKQDKKKYQITPPILDIALEHYLQDNGETRILKAIKGVI